MEGIKGIFLCKGNNPKGGKNKMNKKEIIKEIRDVKIGNSKYNFIVVHKSPGKKKGGWSFCGGWGQPVGPFKKGEMAFEHNWKSCSLREAKILLNEHLLWMNQKRQ